MKPTELAARNRSGGFWAATGNPTVVDHAIVGHVRVDRVVQLVVPADGAARITTSLDLLDWQQTFDLLGRTRPTELIRRVRGAESADPDGTRWPRNKTSDDATSSTSGETLLRRTEPLPEHVSRNRSSRRSWGHGSFNITTPLPLLETHGHAATTATA